MRINKFLTQANYCSRREADRLIEKGLIKINDTVAQLGQQVQTGDRVFVVTHPSSRASKASRGIPPNWTEVTLGTEEKIYLAYHKPVGVICATDTTKPDNIIDAINYTERVYPVGRLDVASSGLILLTNDGDIVNKILKGKQKIEKEYVVDVDKIVTEKKLGKLKKGIVLDWHKTLPAKIKRTGTKRFSITIVEGRNRQIRRMCEAVGWKVVRLHRVRIGSLCLGSLRVGEYRELESPPLDNNGQ